MGFQDIKVQYAALEGAGSDLTTAGQRIRARLDELEGDLRPLQQQWTGEAQASYQAARTTWQAAMDEMVGMLHQTAAAVEQASRAYRATDRLGAERFR